MRGEGELYEGAGHDRTEPDGPPPGPGRTAATDPPGAPGPGPTPGRVPGPAGGGGRSVRRGEGPFDGGLLPFGAVAGVRLPGGVARDQPGGSYGGGELLARADA